MRKTETAALVGALLALKASENALLDYVARLEAQGGMMNYGHSVIRQVRQSISDVQALFETVPPKDCDKERP